MITTGDQLAYVLAAKREITWPVFKNIFEALIQSSQASVQDVPILRNRVLRLLDAFSYCDCKFRKGTGSILVCPATLARLPLHECVGLFVGARSPSTVATLERVAKTVGNITISVEGIDNAAFVPSRVTVHSSDPERLTAFCREAALPIEVDPPCWNLAILSADIDAYIGSLQWMEGPELNWKSWQFDPEYCEFRRHSSDTGRLRLVRYLDPIKNTYRYRLWDGPRYASVDLDWGRYLVLRESDFNVLFYDPRRHLFAVPRGASLPRLLQRAVGLCSGLMPLMYKSRNSVERGALDLFQFVPQTVAKVVSQKVGQSFSECRLN